MVNPYCYRDCWYMWAWTESQWFQWLYFVGLDGNTSAQERERLINRFNAPDNTDVLLFMLSTRSAIVVYKINFLSSVKVLQSKLLLHSVICPGISCYLPKSTSNWSDFLIIFNVLLTIKSPLLVRRVYIYIIFIRQRAIRGGKKYLLRPLNVGCLWRVSLEDIQKFKELQYFDGFVQSWKLAWSLAHE